MSGMGSSLGLTNPTVVAAFLSALRQQSLVALLIFGLLALVWAGARGVRPSGAGPDVTRGRPAAEPAARRLLRVGFGVLWVVDGLLQAQPMMPLGLPSQVIRPAADGSPAWVRHLVDWGAQTWSFHPVAAAAAAVWIQLGIGIWLLAAIRGPWSRLGGLAAAAWGLVVWIFGEAFGGVFAPGLTWLFGAPGAALFYVLAGALVALPDRAWEGRALGRRLLAGLGLFFAGMAVLQAWPGRGYWQGMVGHRPGPLTAMAQDMAQTSQPGFLASLVRAFGDLVARHGFAVNLTVVIALAAVGAAMLSGRPTLLRPALAATAALCLADWVLVEDLGVFGGLGTDPNSMAPMALAVTAGYLALTRAPARLARPASAAVTGVSAGTSPAGARPGWRRHARRIGAAVGSASPRSVVATGSLGIVLLGVVPLTAARANGLADPIIAQAIDGTIGPLDYPAPAFQLTDQNGRHVSMASLRGKVVLLTFLDPVCTDDCPLIAQEFRAAAQLLGPARRHVELVAVNANPIYREIAYLRAFDRQEGLAAEPDWLFLTGSVDQLKQVWQRYGTDAQVLPAGQMIGHSEIAYIINAEGRMRGELEVDPGPGTASSQSSFAAELASAARQELGS